MEGGATLSQLVSNLLMFVILIYVAWKNSNNNKTIINWFVAIGIVVFCLFAFWGSDYFHYKDLFLNYNYTLSLSHVEEVYEPFFNITSNYVVFRLMIWGGAFLLLMFAFYRMQMPMNLVLYVFVAMYLLRFSYARVTLGVAIMFLGYSFIAAPMKRVKIISYAIGILLVVYSINFHKTMILAVSALPLTLLKWNKSNILIALLLFPILVVFVNSSLVNYIMVNDMIEDEQQLYAFNSYMSSHGREGGWGIKLANYLQAIPFYLTIIIFFASKKKYYKIPEKTIQKSFALLVAFLFIASAFAFRQGLIYRRLLYMTYPALIAVIVYVWNYEGKTKWIKTVLVISIIYQAYELLYAVYCLGAK